MAQENYNNQSKQRCCYVTVAMPPYIAEYFKSIAEKERDSLSSTVRKYLERNYEKEVKKHKKTG